MAAGDCTESIAVNDDNQLISQGCRLDYIRALGPYGTIHVSRRTVLGDQKEILDQEISGEKKKGAETSVVRRF